MTEDAYRLYRDYDGAGGQVHGTSVRAASSAVDGVASYAVQALNGKLFVVLLNKDTVSREVTVTVTGGVTGNVDLWRLDNTGYAVAGTLASVSTGFTATLPARTATLARVQPFAGLPSLIFTDGFETGSTSEWQP